jgi:hypothetical protein
LVGTKYWNTNGYPSGMHLHHFILLFFEQTVILPKYKANFHFYCRQIDDIFGVWVHDPENPTAWSDFKVDLQQQCRLDWEIEELGTMSNFLDLTLTLKDRAIVTKTYQKPMNLFLYILEHSVHPPGLLQSLIFGLLQTYLIQNSSIDDFILMGKLLFERITARGYKREQLVSIFEAAMEKLNVTKSLLFEERPQDEQLFFHIPYHPRDVSRKSIRDIYDKVFETGKTRLSNYENLETGQVMQIKKFTITYSRPLNLHNMLCPSTLRETGDIKVSNFL